MSLCITCLTFDKVTGYIISHLFSKHYKERHWKGFLHGKKGSGEGADGKQASFV